MRKFTLILFLAVSACIFSCKGEKTTLDESQTLLNGNWVLDSGCEQDPSPNPIGWLIIHNNSVISCLKESQSVTKGLIVRTKNQGIYRFEWQKGGSSTAEYPVTQWQLLGLTSQGSTSCYSRVKNPANNPPAFCNQ
ncbi:hypothetical protein EHO60_09050 [Leptospira fletcheri]|uniref:Uncharacterized protein n=1 Tax=Leptospira fletcheri TaxID=2484981 RepID=A0A4R9GJN2_9LEPT|nr:hypothetical protein [Leptospira fletcheri]TGK12386.1 hypothetical protein EHO60_09050 [Leptospira fletcheri]